MNDLYRRPPTRNASSTRRALLGLVLAWTGLSVASVPLRAQEQPTPPVGRVVHLWVDPHYGDDVQARANNPGINIQPNKQMPVDWFHQPSNEVLQHFPWPFHTIKGAVDWLVDQSPNNPPLPYTSTDGRYIAEYATIHLRPGRYGPRGAGMNDYFAHSGLYANGATSPNGEVFPIRVPPRVRLRGTSALNTILDAHMDPIGIIEFGKTRTLGTGMTAKSIALTGEGCLIDKVMIVGAADNGMSTMAELRTGIYLWPDLKCTPTITNCVFSFNGYGIVLDAPAGTEIWHTPVIANNTFAGNFIALWNGQRAVSQGSRGNSAPILINNIFDNSVPPNTGGLQGHVPFPFVWGTGSCFEGVDKADVTVQTPVAGDFNAYEKGRYNLGVAFWGLPVTQARNQGPAVPGVDIGPYTGASGLRRGVLYVRDLLLNGRLAGAAFNPGPPWPEFDGGGHDFRLVPAVAPADSLSFKVPGTSGALNPLVDAGIATLPLTMENQRTLAEEPGRIHLSEEAPPWPYHAWNEDCEGYANPRIYDHPSWPASGAAIDIGADELAELVIPSPRFMTTSFLSVDARSVGNPPILINNKMRQKFVWLLGVPDALLNNTPPYVVSPHFMPLIGTNAPWQANWLFDFTTGGYGTNRPTVVDITPHLLPDPHPWWRFDPSIFNPTNPFWKFFANPPDPYNPNLFVQPTSGTLNPPGTFAGNATFTWLDASGHPSNATGIEWDASTTTVFAGTGPRAFLSFDPWCRGYELTRPNQRFATLAKTTTTNDPNLAARFSVELLDGQPRAGQNNKVGVNCQSCLVKVDQ